MHLKILIADDALTNVKLLEAAAHQLGHDVVIAQDGAEAVETYQATDPDLVFIDIMMPRMNGIEAVRKIRSLPSQRWVPIIFHSSLGSTGDIVLCLEAGGDDYLAKPASLELVQAKIRSYERVLSLQSEAYGYTRELSTWREEAELQSKLGQHVVSRLLDAKGLSDPMLQWLNIPAETFSGDLVCAARGPGDVLYVMLADAAGHGLVSALTALPLTQVFYGMAAKGFPISTIAEELNRKLKSFLPIERFVAACLAAVDTRNQTIEIWNGGIPDALFLEDGGSVSMRWPSRHPPLGIMPPELFSNATETVNYQQPGELVLFSDGIIEAENAAGQALSQHGLETVLGSSPKGRRLDLLEEAVLRHLAGRTEHDDLSSIVIQVPIERRQEIRLAQGAASLTEAQVSEWRLELSWGASELREMDIVPAVLGFINQIRILKPHQGQLFLILSELFNNALDHGVLGLDSRLKNMAGGFERYLDERQLKLESLTEARIDMSFHLHQLGDRPALDIRMEDSGKGFDYAALDLLLDEGLEQPQTHGRGVLLVRSLCAEVNYLGEGNAVSARYLM